MCCMGLVKPQVMHIAAAIEVNLRLIPKLESLHVTLVEKVFYQLFGLPIISFINLHLI